ncbi:MAG: hypothetical protein P1R58_09000 [bacterium]|nr:hypothetical protein [bacterium]
MNRWRWREFTPSGVRRGVSFYLKLAYGLLGLFFLCFTAFTSGEEKEVGEYPSLPPSAWYFSWLDFNAPDAETGGESEFVLDDDVDPLAIISDNEPTTPDGGDAEKAEATASWGTDWRHQSLRSIMGQGAMKYLINGAFAGVLAVLLGLIAATLTEWVVRPQLPLPSSPQGWRRLVSRAGGFLFQLVDHIPKLILLIFIYGGISALHENTFALAMGVFLSFGPANLFRERLRAYLASEQYIYAVEFGLSPIRIYLRHFIRRQVWPLLKVQMPFLLSLFVMYEATLYFFNLGSGGKDSWGKLILDNRPHIAWHKVSDFSDLARELGDSWTFLIPMLSLLLIVSSLYILGDALREGSIVDES